jgi:hypothetical protein
MSGEGGTSASVSVSSSLSLQRKHQQQGPQGQERVAAGYVSVAAAVAELNGEVARLGELHAAVLEQRERAVLPYAVAVGGVVARATGAAAGGDETAGGAQLRVRH